MATSLKNLSKHNAEAVPSGKGKKVVLIVSEWNEQVTLKLRDGAIWALKKYQTAEKNISVVYVPGTFELTYAAARCIQDRTVDAVICIGCVIKGETPHFDYICQGVANGISALNAQGKKPVIFGVLTTNDMQQALDRSGGKHGNKGVEAAVTALKMISFSGK
jgi:6,7-dimethyl-8-ribityllumazine synthase